MCSSVAGLKHSDPTASVELQRGRRIGSFCMRQRPLTIELIVVFPLLFFPPLNALKCSNSNDHVECECKSELGLSGSEVTCKVRDSMMSVCFVLYLVPVF